MAYNFSIVLAPYGNPETTGIISIDPESLYGCFEKPSGAEGGGLWFELNQAGKIELIDYDGQPTLPKKVIKALRDNGFIVDESFEY